MRKAIPMHSSWLQRFWTVFRKPFKPTTTSMAKSSDTSLDIYFSSASDQPIELPELGVTLPIGQPYSGLEIK